MRADLVPMQTTHSAFNLSCAQIAETISLRRFDEYATKQANHTGCVYKMVRLAGWHCILDGSDKVVAPRSILSAHMVLFEWILFLVSLE